LPLLLVVRLAVFFAFRLLEGMWQYVTMRGLVTILKATTLGSILFAVGLLPLGVEGFPRSVLLLDWIFCLMLMGGVRLVVQGVYESSRRGLEKPSRRALVVGGGDAAQRLIRAVDQGYLTDYELVGLIDDDMRKRRKRVQGIPVIGTVEEIPRLTESLAIDEVLIALPSASLAEKRRIANACRDSHLPMKSVPLLRQLIQDKSLIGQLEPVAPEDLLAREPVKIELDQVREELREKIVLVTGAGGSIGTELCRQLAPFEPKGIVMLDRAESSLFLAHEELRARYHSIDLTPVVGDITNQRELDDLFRIRAPHIVYHAAAYKHVPLMENHPLAAIQNNIFGTEKVAVASVAAGVQKLVFISTDKAVNSVGTMGRTKRIAENVLLSLKETGTTFVVVRFGNVLGSNGSVVPLFQRQLLSGGPITITHPEATRYFMLLSEAAQLVLQAGAMGQGGEVFFLDMGEAVRIVDLAENLIRLSGLSPGRDVAVETIGLRPGERLSEMLINETEVLARTKHPRILVTKRTDGFDRVRFLDNLEVLRRLVRERETDPALAVIKSMAAEY